MEVAFHANISDMTTWQFPKLLREPFKSVARAVSNDYGGPIDQLWIDFELTINRRSKRLRFQKKVGGSRNRLTGLQTAIYANVCHYSVRPDFDIFLNLPLDRVAGYSLNLVYQSTVVLIEKRSKFKGFDVDRFREEMLSACVDLGYIPDTSP